LPAAPGIRTVMICGRRLGQAFEFLTTDEHGLRDGAGEKAAEGRRSPRPGGNAERPGVREASWSAPALWCFLELVPDVNAKLKAPNTKDEKFEDVVKSAQDAAVLVLVY
jgi:hypothetical protein